MAVWYVAGVATESLSLRQGLVAQLRAEGQLRTAAIAEAFEAVPRELFVPGVPLEEVYRSSEPILVKSIDGVRVSSASAPDVMACMLEQLQPRHGQSVLEIGAGSGYNAALLAHLVGPHGSVVSIDIDADLVAAAREHLDSAGYSRVQVVQSDGALGYEPRAPFDRVILTVASRDIAPAWRDQLGKEGRLLLPLGIRGIQRCIAFERRGDHLGSVSVGPCSFIPLRGVLSMESARIPIDRHGAILLGLPDDTATVEPKRVLDWLLSASSPVPSGVFTTVPEVRNSLQVWLAAHDERVCSLRAEPGVEVVPNLIGNVEQARVTLGLLQADGIGVLDWGPDNQLRASGALAQPLIEHLHAWSRAGRPPDGGLYVRAYPQPSSAQPQSNEIVIDQRWTRFVLGFSLPPA